MPGVCVSDVSAVGEIDPDWSTLPVILDVDGDGDSFEDECCCVHVDVADRSAVRVAVPVRLNVSRVTESSCELVEEAVPSAVTRGVLEKSDSEYE